MKEPMSYINIYGNKKDRKAVLEYLQRSRVIDIVSGVNEKTRQLGFDEINTSEAQSEFLQKSNLGSQALDILSRYAPQKGGLFDSLKGRQVLTAKEYYESVDKIPETLSAVEEIISLSTAVAEKEAMVVRAKAELEEVEPWLGLDGEARQVRTGSTVSFVGTFGDSLTRDEIVEKYNSYESPPPVHIEVVKQEVSQTYVFAVCKADDLESCENILRGMGFSRPKRSLDGVPSQIAARLQEEIKQIKAELEDIKSQIAGFEPKTDEIKFLIDYYAMRGEKYKVLSHLAQREKVFVISGYVPENRAEDLCAELEYEYNVAVEVEPAGEDAPVLLKNGGFASPVETVVETFALPKSNEIDPTAIMAPFYYILFGLMLSDAAYGLLMVIGCGWALSKFKNMEESMKKSLKMFLYCGISTMFWGVMFGSYFGDAIPVVSETFFGKKLVIPPLWFEPVKEPMRMLMFSFLVGLIHLFTGLGVKIYQCIRAKDYMSMLVDGVFWFMLVGGIVVYLFRVDMFLSIAGLDCKLPEFWANVALVVALIGAVGILLLTSRTGGVGKRLAKGAYSLYGITSWLSDILSYSRLLALGLATGVIATVFNKMGSMFGGGIVGAIIFIIVFVIGHTLNIGVNLLGAYVHTNRLQFVEFFGKFYEGGGRMYSPFSANTKYYKFK